MIRIICVGNLKEKYWKDAIYEYSTRLSKYTKLEVIEIEEEGLKAESDANILKAIEIEGSRILSHINSKDYVILNAIKGNQLDSIEFANKLDEINTNGFSNIDFIIGGSYGTSEEVYKRANYKLSFSKFTMPHQLFRVVLLEQIYRAYKILRKEKYHK